MARHGVQRDKTKVAGKVLLLAATSCGALAVSALGAAGTANASCASFNGAVSVGKGCTTTDTGDIAIGIGRQTTVTASGGRNVAIAIGNPGPNAYESGATIPTTAFAEGQRNRAFAFGNGTLAGASGFRNSGTAIGSGSLATGSGFINGGVQNRALAFGPHNVAVALGGTPGTDDSGGHNTAIVVGRSSTAQVNFTNVGTKNTSAVAVGKDKFVNK